MDLIRLRDETSSKERLAELSPNLFGQLFMILQYSEPYPPKTPFQRVERVKGVFKGKTVGTIVPSTYCTVWYYVL